MLEVEARITTSIEAGRAKHVHLLEAVAKQRRAVTDRLTNLRQRVGRVSDRVLLEEALHELEAQAHQLGRALVDREEILVRERARRQELERANRANDRFLSVVTHDLRGPIHAVLGWIRLLRREHLDGYARNDVFARIERITCMQLGLVDALLDVSRLVGDRVHLELVCLDLHVLVRRVVDRLAAHADSVGVSVDFVADTPPFRVMGDAQRLEQATERLVTNALRFTREGGHVSVRLEHAGGARVRLTIGDDGRGIAPERIPKLFAGVQVDRHDPHARGGGFGLFIVRRLIELHDGTVSAASEGPERGSMFTIELPAS